MTTPRTPLTVMPVLALICAYGCGEPNEEDPAGGDTSVTPTAVSPAPFPNTTAVSPAGAVSPVSGAACPARDEAGVTMLKANEVHNYGFTSALNFNLAYVKPNTELTLDWTGLSKDFLNHDVNPLIDIDMVLILVWKMPPEELAIKMNQDVLAQADTAAFAMIYPEDMFTSASILQAQAFQNPLTPEEIMPTFDPTEYDPNLYTYTIMTRTGTETKGLGTRMIRAFKLDPSSTETTVTVDNTSTTLTWDADLTSLTPTYVPPGSAAISIDWNDMTTTAMGTEFKPFKVGEVLVAHYAETPAELESKFLDLKQIAIDEWRGTVEVGTSMVLSDLQNESGAPFTGIDNTGTWLIGLICGDCANPSPWYLSPLQPCTP